MGGYELPLPKLTVINGYRLTGSPEVFRAAIAALVAKVRVEGHPGVIGYRFYLDAEGGTARGIVDYAEPADWIAHHDIAMHWPEMTALHAVAPLAEATFLGEVTPEITAWLARSGLRATIRQGYALAAGFRRDVTRGG